jgi:hypothetical protein
MDKQIEKEIEELRALGLDKPGFKVPSNYFEEFSESIFSKIQEEEIPQETGFNTPEAYFEKVEETILSNINFPKKKKRLHLKVIYTISSIAAAIVLYFGISQYQKPETVSFDSLTTTDIQEWIAKGNMNIDSYDIASIEFEHVWSTNIEMDEVSTKEINNYLDTVEPEFLFIEN